MLIIQPIRIIDRGSQSIWVWNSAVKASVVDTVSTEVDPLLMKARPAADVPRARERLSPIGTKGVEKEKVRRRS